jgi:DNA-binding PadR family transcriptional regulator
MQNETIYPELKETTTAIIEYKCSYNGGYYVTTDLQLKGQGIKQVGDDSTHKRGKKTYQVTENALKNLKKVHSSCYLGSL